MTLSPDTKRRAEEQMHHFGVVTHQSLVRTVTDLDQAVANQITASMVEAGKWTRYTWRLGGHTREGYAPSKHTVRVAELRERLAVLHFCCCTPSTRPLLSDAQWDDLVVNSAKQAGLSAPPRAPCFSHRASKVAPKRLSLIRVGRTTNLQSVIEELDQYVSSPAFTVWWYFAKSGGFALTYLLPGSPELAQELSRWVRRRPPVSRLKRSAVVVPVWVHVARTVPVPTAA